jgi:hypothetical protein
VNHEGINIELSNLRQVIRKRTNSQERVLKDRNIRRGLAPEARKQPICLQAPNHVGGVVRGQWGEPNRDIAEDFHHDPSHPTGNHRPEVRVLDDAKEHLGSFRDHPLHEEPGWRVPLGR